MPSPNIKIKLFLSCPGGLNAEKEAVREVCTTTNRERGSREGFHLEIIEWRTNVRPSAGGEPQQLINEQIGDDYDIFVGILGHRFGTATQSYGSGTEEEFELAVQQHKAGNSRPIMLYFKDPKQCDGAIEATQLMKVQEFKSRIEKENYNLYWDFATTEEFRMDMFQHLSGAISEVLAGYNERTLKQASLGSDQPNPTPLNQTNPLANLTAILELDESEEGFIELVDAAVEELESMNLETNKLSDAVARMGSRIEKITADMELLLDLPESKRPKEAKKLIGRLNAELSSYVQTAAQLLPPMHRHGTASVDSIQKAVALINTHTLISDEDREGFIVSTDQMIAAFTSTKEPLLQFNRSLDEWPPLTRESNRVKRQVQAVNSDIDAYLSILVDQLTDLRDSVSTE